MLRVGIVKPTQASQLVFAGQKKPKASDAKPVVTPLPDHQFTKPLREILKAYGLKPRQYQLKRDGWMDNNNPTGLPTPNFSLTLLDEDALARTRTLLVDKYLTSMLVVTGKYRPNQDNPTRQGLLDRYMDLYTEQGMEGGFLWCLTPGDNQRLSFYNGELGLISLKFKPKGPLTDPKNEQYTRFQHYLDYTLVQEGMMQKQLEWANIKLDNQPG